MPSRIDTLQGPQGAARAPLLLWLLVLAVAVAMVAIGIWGWGWLAALLVPAVVFSLYVAVRVVAIMAGEIRDARAHEGVDEEE